MAHHTKFTDQPAVDANPRESVILALTESWTTVDTRVSTVWPACRRRGTELVVACVASAAQVAAAGTRYPGVRFVAAAPGATSVQLRRLGLEVATGDIVTMVDSRVDSVRRLLPFEHDLRMESVS